MSQPDIILRGIQDPYDADTLLRLAMQFQADHPERKPRDVVIYSCGEAESRVYTCHWTRDHATVVYSAKRVKIEVKKDSALGLAIEKVFRAVGRPVPPLD